ncbi:sulfotransferase [Methylobacterium aquaticum]|uniref:sulfotransferase n=1 Tax=Methylobacterium aquaticum TaxID=270351 RepID=UPI003D1830F4
MTLLFILGFARSGTTVLLNALNTSADVYLMGEVSIYLRMDAPGFRKAVNDQGFSFGNQRTKSTYAPRLKNLGDEASAREYVQEIEKRYRYVGEKIALSHHHDIIRLDMALETEWPDAPMIWTLRRPRFALASVDRVLGNGELRRDINAIARTFLFFIDCARLRRDVFVLVQGQIGRDQFQFLEKKLIINLEEAADLFNEIPYDDHSFGRDGEFKELLGRLDVIYDTLISLIDIAKCRIPQPVLQAEEKLATQRGSRGEVSTSGALGIIVRELMDIVEKTLKI